MSWRVGYPGNLASLDDAHEDIGGVLRAMKQISEPSGAEELRALSFTLLRKLKSHCRQEEVAMEELRYPQRELHIKHHQDVADAIETLISIFDLETMFRCREGVIQHIENRISEELFVDQLLVEFATSARRH
jgi:hemerythrin